MDDLKYIAAAKVSLQYFIVNTPCALQTNVQKMPQLITG
jgi:hypothetical protein